MNCTSQKRGRNRIVDTEVERGDIQYKRRKIYQHALRMPSTQTVSASVDLCNLQDHHDVALAEFDIQRTVSWCLK